MDQYRPCHRAVGHPELGRAITAVEYGHALAIAQACGLHRLDRRRPAMHRRGW